MEHVIYLLFRFEHKIVHPGLFLLASVIAVVL